MFSMFLSCIKFQPPFRLLSDMTSGGECGVVVHDDVTCFMAIEGDVGQRRETQGAG